MPWTEAPMLKDGRMFLAAVDCAAPSPESGFRIYAIGGTHFFDGSVLPTVEVYDPSRIGWSSIKELPTPRFGLAAATLGRLHTFGGTDATFKNVLGTHEVYDPATAEWTTELSEMPTARTALAAVAAPGGLIYTLGGWDGQKHVGTVEVYDPSNRTWVGTEPMPTPRSSLAAVVGPDEFIYAIGGADETGPLPTVEKFRVDTGWLPKPGDKNIDLPVPIQALAAAAGPKPLVYAIGGSVPVGNGDTNTKASADIYSFDPSTQVWTNLNDPMLTARFGLAAVTGPDGLIYAIGGLALKPDGQGLDAELNIVEAFTSG